MPRALILALIAPFFFAGCKKKGGDAPMIQEETEPRADLTLIEVDIDSDGQADIFNYYEEPEGAARWLARKEVDLNYDGKVDVITYYDASGQVTREEMDGDFDGQFDTTDHYEGGVRVSTDRDTNYDGRADTFTTYTAGPGGEVVPTSQERDTNGDGTVDEVLKFDGQGNVQVVDDAVPASEEGEVEE